MKLVDNLYAYPWKGNDNNCSSYVFAGALNQGKHVLIDPGHLVTPYYREAGLERLLGAMERDGLADAPIGLVVLTHSHPDHAESAIVLRQESQALIAMHEADAPAFAALGGTVDLFLDEGTLKLGGTQSTMLQVYHSPGHTPGHITVYWPKQSVLIAGDCIFYRSTGRADLPGGDARALQQTIEKLSKLEVEHLLCGHPYGHPGIISGREEVRENFQFIRQLFY
jgi:glyoxylase-like metal-dependent hydrolase (beta-lactamase superfamily II)